MMPYPYISIQMPYPQVYFTYLFVDSIQCHIPNIKQKAVIKDALYKITNESIIFRSPRLIRVSHLLLKIQYTTKLLR